MKHSTGFGRGHNGSVIDHLVYAGPDLAVAAAGIATLLGATPSPGGSHVGRGTHNQLLALGETTYLEVIGPDPSQPEPEGVRPFGIDDITAPALVAWCARPTRPLADIVAEAAVAGIEFGSITTMSRRRPDGMLLEWHLTVAQPDGPFGCALPFLIDWGGSAHPTDTLARGARLVALDLVHPDVLALRAALDIIGIGIGEVDVQPGPHPALRARLAPSGGGQVTLSG